MVTQYHESEKNCLKITPSPIIMHIGSIYLISEDFLLSLFYSFAQNFSVLPMPHLLVRGHRMLYTPPHPLCQSKAAFYMGQLPI